MPILERPQVKTFHTPELVNEVPVPTEGEFEAVREFIRDNDHVHKQLGNKSLYLVMFCSVREEGIDGAEVARLDKAAHEEAEKSEALLHYSAGEIDLGRRALSWCLWTDQESARDALHGPAHREAVSRAPEFYGDNFTVGLYDVSLSDEQEIILDPQTHS